MFTNVLVGVDGHWGGRDAIALARRLAAPEATITLAHVFLSDWLLPRGAGLVAPLAADGSQGLLCRERDVAGIDAHLLSVPRTSPGRGARCCPNPRRLERRHDQGAVGGLAPGCSQRSADPC